jgi:hypothetical protein
VALGSASMIRLPFSGSESESEPTYDLEAFTSATNDCFEWHSTVLCQGLLWNSPISQCLSSSSHCPSLFTVWIGCPEVVPPFSALYSVGWDRLFPASIGRCLETQTIVSSI